MRAISKQCWSHPARLYIDKQKASVWIAEGVLVYSNISRSAAGQKSSNVRRNVSGECASSMEVNPVAGVMPRNGPAKVHHINATWRTEAMRNGNPAGQDRLLIHHCATDPTNVL